MGTPETKDCNFSFFYCLCYVCWICINYKTSTSFSLDFSSLNWENKMHQILVLSFHAQVCPWILVSFYSSWTILCSLGLWDKMQADWICGSLIATCTRAPRQTRGKLQGIWWPVLRSKRLGSRGLYWSTQPLKADRATTFVDLFFRTIVAPLL